MKPDPLTTRFGPALAIISSVLLSACASRVAELDPPGSAELHVEVEGLVEPGEIALFQVFRAPGEGYPLAPLSSVRSAISAVEPGGTSAAWFRDLPQGRYAVVVIHDRDRDGRFTLGVDGIGFSSDAGPSDDFETASFDLPSSVTVITVPMIYPQAR